MNSKKSLLSGVVALMMVAGCGGGSGGGGSHSSTSPETVAAALASLNTALGSGSSSDLTTATQNFNRAYATTPTDPRAALGSAVTLSAQAAQALAAELGVPFTRSRAASASPVNSAIQRLMPLTDLLGQVGGKNRLTAETILPMELFNGGSRSRKSRATGRVASLTPAQVRDALAGASQSLDTVLARLTPIASPNSVIDDLETNPLIVVYQGHSVKLGKVEGYALRSAVHAVKGILDAALAYDLDYGTYDANALITTKLGTKLQTDGATITTADYLPAGPTGTFGNLESNGALLTVDLKNQWIKVGIDGTSAIEAYKARLQSNSTGYLADLAPTLFDVSAPSTESLATAEGDLTNLIAGLTTPFSATITVADTDYPVTIDLPTFLASPPANLKSLFPSLTVSRDSVNQLSILTPKSGSMDATFHGLFKNGGIPDALLYSPDRQFYVYDDDEAPLSILDAFAFDFFAPDVI